MKVFYAPIRVNAPPAGSVFLAGSIDMGQAVNWQQKFEKEFAYFPVVIFNPRRDDWDSSWKQEDSDPQFREQVEWELDYIKAAEHVFMFISKESKAPITLLEFGHISTAWPEKLTICVEEGFWRRGNIEVVCRRNGIRLFSKFEEAAESLKIKMAAEL